MVQRLVYLSFDGLEDSLLVLMMVLLTGRGSASVEPPVTLILVREEVKGRCQLLVLD